MRFYLLATLVVSLLVIIGDEVATSNSWGVGQRQVKYYIFNMVWNTIGFRGLLFRFNIGANGRQMILAEYQKRPLSNIQPQPMVGVDFNSHFKSDKQ